MTASISGRGATWVFAGAAAASLGAVTVALVSQHVFGMQPCPWCVLQRVILLATTIVATIGVFWRSDAGRRFAATFALLFAACGVAAAAWQHFRAAASASCNLTLADRIVTALRLDAALPAVFEPRASCADAAVSLLGVPYDFWGLALFVLLALSAAWLLARPRGRALR